MATALIVADGWEGHEPLQCADLFAGVLRGDGYHVAVADTLDVYLDAPRLRGTLGRPLTVRVTTTG